MIFNNQNDLSRRDFIKAAFGTFAAVLTPALLSSCDSVDDITQNDVDEYYNTKGNNSSSSVSVNGDSPTEAHMNIAKFYSKFGLGPLDPETPELVELVVNLYTAEEAEVAQHMTLILGRTTEFLSWKSGVPIERVDELCDVMGGEKYSVLMYGAGEPAAVFKHMDVRRPKSNYPHGNPLHPRRYSLIPLVPGLYELALWEDTGTEWQKRVSSSFEKLIQTGYLGDVYTERVPANRYIPIEKTIKRNYRTLPTDLLSEVVDVNDSFALTSCGCRRNRYNHDGTVCEYVQEGASMDTCLLSGVMADVAIEKGWGRRIDKYEAYDIKLKANEAGLVTWCLDVDRHEATFYCSCCKDCCYSFRMITESNAPGLFVRPNYYPKTKRGFDCSDCNEECSVKCPTNAIIRTTDSSGKEVPELNKKRCIGCGVCQVACPNSCLEMKRVLFQHRPPKNYFMYGLQIGPGVIMNRLAKLFSGKDI